VLLLLRRLTIPSIVVLHTVLMNPTSRQRALLEQIVDAAGAAVVMTETAHSRLLAGYAVDPAKITVIPHGAAGNAARPTETRQRPHLLTWGLLGPGKGIEWVLRALAQLQDLVPSPTYTVAGKTHPKVIARHGEAYRAGLYQLGAQLGVSTAVRYDPVYRDDAALGRLIRSADIIDNAETPGGGPTEGIGLLAAVIVLLIAFGSLLAMGLPIVTAIFGIGTGLAGIDLLGHVLPATGFSPIVTGLIGLGVGVDYALFIVMRYREALEGGAGPEEATGTAIATAGRSVLFAGTTWSSHSWACSSCSSEC
jgi:glycosyltransferase involved in cell wall biosynthesis